MKSNSGKTKGNRGFTLIEMIGVLAVIAILAAVLIPKVFEAINSSRISNTALSCNTVKTAVADHYAKFGSLATDGSGVAPVALNPIPYPDYDKLLVTEGFLDKAFAVKIGDGVDAVNSVSLNVVANPAPAAPAVGNATYNLDGSGAVDTPAAVSVVEAIISGASLEDAQSLDKLIDGADPTMSSPASTTGDINGRVKWAPNTAGTAYDINVYLTHR